MLFLEVKIHGFVDSQVVISFLTSHQLHVNDFELYLRNPLNDDPRNLFSLRCDLHSLQFDQVLSSCRNAATSRYASFGANSNPRTCTIISNSTMTILCFTDYSMLDLHGPSSRSYRKTILPRVFSTLTKKTTPWTLAMP